MKSALANAGVDRSFNPSNAADLFLEIAAHGSLPPFRNLHPQGPDSVATNPLRQTMLF